MELEGLCAAFGHVLSIRFLDDKACGKSRGMAIVEFAESEAAAACIAGLNGCVVVGGGEEGMTGWLRKRWSGGLGRQCLPMRAARLDLRFCLLAAAFWQSADHAVLPGHE